MKIFEDIVFPFSDNPKISNSAEMNKFFRKSLTNNIHRLYNNFESKVNNAYDCSIYPNIRNKVVEYCNTGDQQFFNTGLRKQLQKMEHPNCLNPNILLHLNSLKLQFQESKDNEFEDFKKKIMSDKEEKTPNEKLLEKLLLDSDAEKNSKYNCQDMHQYFKFKVENYQLIHLEKGRLRETLMKHLLEEDAADY